MLKPLELSLLRSIVKKLILSLPPDIREVTRELLRNGLALVRYTTYLIKWLATQSPIVPNQFKRWVSPFGKLTSLRKARISNNDSLVLFKVPAGLKLVTLKP